MKQEIKTALLGCLEIPLFMRVGATRFQNTKQAAISSFLIPFLTLIPTAELAQINPDFTGQSYFSIFGTFLLIFLTSSALFYTASFISMWAIEKKEYFFVYINGTNWLGLTFFVINLPFFLLVYTGIFTYQEMTNLFIFLLLFGYTYQAYFITRVLGVHWMLGAALSIMGMFSDDLAQKIVLGTS